MDLWRCLLFLWMLIFVSLTTIAGEEFTCFRKFQQPKGLCSGLIRSKKTDNNPEKCCTGKGAGFTLDAVVKVRKNRYQCESCESWLRQRNGITTPSVPKFTCFRKFKTDHCSGLVADERSNQSPKNCCEGKGNGFATESLKTIGRNKYECVSCDEWRSQTSRVTTPSPSTTTKDLSVDELNKLFESRDDKADDVDEFTESQKNLSTKQVTERDIHNVQRWLYDNKRVPTIGSWGPWGPCSTSCGAGWRSRYRDCINCDKNHYENVMSEPCVIKLKCPQDGNWGPWHPWQTCTASCGGGVRRRERRCNYPPPTHGGLDCLGSAIDQESCSEQPCPVDGSWGPWARFTVCSATCGRGTMMRNRLCDSPAPANGGANCPGHDFQHRPCENRLCPQDGGWSEWSALSDCPVTCGTGSRTRSRDCNSPRPLFGGRDCIGEGVETHECDSGNPCPIDGNWGHWTSYGPCRANKCESGFQLRSRSCNNPRPQNRGRLCVGSTVDRVPCTNLEGCLVNGDWCNWEGWSTCTATCSSVTSIQVRKRLCSCPPPQLGGAQCEGQDYDTQICEGISTCSAFDISVQGAVPGDKTADNDKTSTDSMILDKGA